jgi:hypothetical protein
VQHYGPIWIDPRYYEYRYRPPHRVPWDVGVGRPYSPSRPAPVAAPVDEDRIRKIVREEIAGLPIRFDVPDAPPES